ncbi:phosphoribosylaminoimidazolesuccinocarboxamide synthase [Batrachochytrium dendrobatidis JEL423]|uniref:Phosphoribosylaminoimidazole-succinocarboxamide synthase n=1 Tax=Batrachochytrium dendrobatidis (strain JEL423) TaxID=403673 RepID=A0A177WRU8_BATDL|nr:phosphoribosylaminoimidazolesuccinocarboxamide synthase [Batrachochytrium dendrobatidis JEL423]
MAGFTFLVAAIIGDRYSKEVAAASLKIYKKASEYAQSKGIIIADTKVEFGVNEAGDLILADEVLTPVIPIDSSRFWPAKEYKAGKSQPSFDKQYLRDYLSSINFDKKNGVKLPQTVMDNTLSKYIQVYKTLTGKDPVL